MLSSIGFNKSVKITLITVCYAKIKNQTEPYINVNQNQIEQTKPSKPQKQFNEEDYGLIEYDDEKMPNSSVPLPGM